MAKEIVDAHERAEALDAGRSFIVQAPAGSGKTGLITQRFLTLLAVVERPEEVVAITFTRKAAGEMRSRILEALVSAKGPQPDDPHAAKTWGLAKAALVRDGEKGWQVLSNPSRLSVQTIDSLCGSLTRQLPLLSTFGAQPSVSDDASALYQEAARMTLLDLEQGEDWSPAIEALLRHLDNDLNKAQSMLVTMLAKRDQWLRHLFSVLNTPDDVERREVLESALQGAISEALEDVREYLGRGDGAELLSLIQFAAANLGEDHALHSWLEFGDILPPEPEYLDAWRSVAELCFTATGAWRKTVTAKQGFLAKSAGRDKEEKSLFESNKKRMISLLASWEDLDDWQCALQSLLILPEPHYDEAQWLIVEAMCEMLKVAALHLRVVFGQHAQVDFSEISQAALMALGEEDNPTDLALALDYRIKHLLIDEFQDTSFGQFELLKRLTAGWVPDDGRTLFLVGDPMQSIYRFREAEVGLYFQARDFGVGEITLDSLTLSVNFRSQGGIVDWVNKAFRHVLPAKNDHVSGAAAYSASHAFHETEAGEAVTIHPFLENNKVAEAEVVASQIKHIFSNVETGQKKPSVAILVRSRGHLVEIIPALKQARLRFQAVDIERLDHRPVVQDLRALTRALLHPADRVAWLACLRAPWCGLVLQDLEALTLGERNGPIWALMQDEPRCAQLSELGQQRLARLRQVMAAALDNRRRRSLRAWLEATWLALGGPACVEDETDLEDAEVYFTLLEKIDHAGDLADVDDLDLRLERLFALPDVEADSSLQLMTIHKSKGLEFDHVFMPGLGSRGRNDDKPLLMWMERAGRMGEGQLMLAPVQKAVLERDKKKAAQQTKTYDYLRYLEKTKGEFELGRVLYVGATRARTRLHLLGHVNYDAEKGNDLKAAKGSLLGLLWSQVEAVYERAGADQQEVDGGLLRVVDPAQATLSRLPVAWVAPEIRSVSEVAPRVDTQQENTLWQGSTPAHIGTVVHLGLQHIAEQGVDVWQADRIADQRLAFQAQLQALGVVEEELPLASERVVLCLQQALNDERGRWILADHQAARCELPITGVFEGEIVNLIIDRTFIDEQGRRWIIDYKTSAPAEDQSLDEFIAEQQQHYRAQLERYALFMADMDERPIHLAIYFPQVPAWCEWTVGRCY